MGKPIADNGKSPFVIGGMLINGANIDGVTRVKDLYIKKQSSYNMYDLMDDVGVVYKDIELVYTDMNKKVLDFYTPDETLVDVLKKNTFYIKEQDLTTNVYGFATLYQLNKIKIHNGKYIFRDTQNVFNIYGVKVEPTYITVNKADAFKISTRFIPEDYVNPKGYWVVQDEDIIQKSTNRNSEIEFVGLKEGTTTATFIPHDNKTLSAHTIIKVTDEPILVNSMIAFLVGFKTPSAYFEIEDEFEVALAFNPINYTPSKPATVTITSNTGAIEYIGTDDNKIYKFKINQNDNNKIGSAFNYEEFKIDFKYDDLVAEYTDKYCKWWPAKRIYFQGNSLHNVGDTYKFNVLYGSVDGYSPLHIQPPNPEIQTWTSSNQSIIKIDKDTGLAQMLSKGKCEIRVSMSGLGWASREIEVSENIPSSVTLLPAFARYAVPGEQIQFTVKYEPEEFNIPITWRTDIPSKTGHVNENGLMTCTNTAGVNDDTTVSANVPPYVASANIYARSSHIIPKTITVYSVLQGTDTLYMTKGSEHVLNYRYHQATTVNFLEWVVSVDDPSVIELGLNSRTGLSYGNTMVKALKSGTSKFKVYGSTYPDIVAEITIIVI